jgi:hypothetical protein
VHHRSSETAIPTESFVRVDITPLILLRGGQTSPQRAKVLAADTWVEP